MKMSDRNYDPTIPRLVSYPRTGSHWVRLVLEQYLNKYCLPTSFFDNTDYWGYHLHDRIVGRGDEGITSDFDKVIYLYRDPVDTIFSILNYENLDFSNAKNVQKLSSEYFIHLHRWLFNNSDIKNIIFVKYEQIKNKPVESFTDILKFLDYEIDESKLSTIFDSTTIKITNSKTGLNKNIINNDHFTGKYNIKKEKFQQGFAALIREEFLSVWK